MSSATQRWCLQYLPILLQVGAVKNLCDLVFNPPEGQTPSRLAKQLPLTGRNL